MLLLIDVSSLILSSRMQCTVFQIHDDCDDSMDMDAYDVATDYTCPKCRDEGKMDTETTQSENLVPPVDVEAPLSVKSEETSKEVKPAKRSSISSSLESDVSCSAMKGGFFVLTAKGFCSPVGRGSSCDVTLDAGDNHFFKL